MKRVVGGISTNATKSNAADNLIFLSVLLTAAPTGCSLQNHVQATPKSFRNPESALIPSLLSSASFRIHVQDPSVPVQLQPVNHPSLAQMMSCKCAYVAEMMTCSCLNRESLTHSFLSSSISPLYPGRAVMWPG